MILEKISIGTTDNDNQGEPLRSAFDKINRNFDKLTDIVTYRLLEPTPTLENGTSIGDRKTLINISSVDVEVTQVTGLTVLTSLQIIDIVWNGSQWIKVG